MAWTACGTCARHAPSEPHALRESASSAGRMMRNLRASLPILLGRIARVVPPVARFVSRRWRGFYHRLRATALVVSGGGSIDYAAFQVNRTFGWLVLGVSLLVLEYLMTDDKTAGEE